MPKSLYWYLAAGLAGIAAVAIVTRVPTLRGMVFGVPTVGTNV